MGERKEFKVNLGIVLACVVAQPALAKTFHGRDAFLDFGWWCKQPKPAAVSTALVCCNDKLMAATSYVAFSPWMMGPPPLVNPTGWIHDVM